MSLSFLVDYRHQWLTRLLHRIFFFFFFNDTAPTEIYTLSLHDALPISPRRSSRTSRACAAGARTRCCSPRRDRKSTRLNSSHSQISYAVFCLKKKKKVNDRGALATAALDAYRDRSARTSAAYVLRDRYH